MEITGKIIRVCELRQGTSKSSGNEWQSQDYVLETDEQYPKHVCFTVFGKDKIEQFNISEGDNLTVSFDIDANEYQNRWYNKIQAWKVVNNQNALNAQEEKQQPIEQKEKPIHPKSEEIDGANNLPF